MIYATWFMILAAAQLVYACDPVLARLFTPAAPLVGRYEVCTSAASLDDELARSTGAGVAYAPAELVDALDAFGLAGSYDRSRMARLFRGARPRVARGYRDDGDRFESVTLISPYPDAALSSLRPGTLRIRFELRTREK
jgi:hypothetical protein